MPKKKTSSKKAKEKTEKKAKASEKKVKDMMQTHAKEEKFEPSTLDQVWGENVNTKYGTIDEAQYLNKLHNMNTTDLQSHAHMHGLIPIQDRVRLVKVLVSEFRKYVSGFQKPAAPVNPPPNISDESARTLAEGR
jgi:hypothetical protein